MVFNMCSWNQSHWPHLGNMQVTEPIMRTRGMICSDGLNLTSMVLISTLSKPHRLEVGEVIAQREIRVLYPKIEEWMPIRQNNWSPLCLTNSELSFKCQFGYYFHFEVFLATVTVIDSALVISILFSPATLYFLYHSTFTLRCNFLSTSLYSSLDYKCH